MAEKKKAPEKKAAPKAAKKEAPKKAEVKDTKVEKKEEPVKIEAKETKAETHTHDHAHDHAHEHKAEKTGAEKPEKKEAKKKKEEKVDIVSETVYNVPLRKVYRSKPYYKRSNKAVAMLIKFIQKHMKEDNVKLTAELNQFIWARGDCKPPRMVQVKATKDSKGKVTVSLLK